MSEDGSRRMEPAQSYAKLKRHIPELAINWAVHTPEARWQLLPGTLCFADISGFTALAERLAQRGRMGGEELVETLGRVFTTMMGVARARGGSLLKFGGDALLLFFQGDDHAVQAASAAVEMRKALREASRTPTSVGPLNLSMSVGLHSGDVHFFLVGTTHRELILLGPAANGVVETENAANAGEILVSDSTKALLPNNAVKPRDDGRWLLRWRKGAPDAAGDPQVSDADDEVVASLFPGELGKHLAPGAPDPEHRVACIAFIRFSGTDALLAERGAEALAGALHETVGGVQEVLVEEGVTLLAIDLDRDGGKFFMAAGVPHASEDDEGVMLRALRRIADWGLPLPLQIGVNRGHVFAAEVGDARRAAFSAMGDTTNTAARITAKTPIGKIYAHPDTLDECLTVFESTAADPLTLKGKKAPLVVYEVGAQLGMRDREGLDVDVFVGREKELARLREATDALANGTGGVIGLLGATGLGKTRLLREMTSSLDREQLLSLRAEPYGVASAYRMFRDPIRDLLGISRGKPQVMRRRLERVVRERASHLEPWLALIGDVTQIPIEPSEELKDIEAQFLPEKTAEAIIALIEAFVPGPLVIAVDESHWSDEASTHLLEQMAGACEGRPWLMLAAYREAESGFRPAEEIIEIAPMPDGEIEELVRIATEAAPLRPHEMETVVRRAGGYPLFAEEIIRALRDVGSLDAVPESLEAAMAAQVDALDPPARRVLQRASILGRSFSRSDLETLLANEGHVLDDAMIDRLSEFLHVDSADRLRFRSGMLRDTVYEGVAYRRRARLHQLAGEVMEVRVDDVDAIADALALHFSRSGDEERTWIYACVAGDSAREKYLNADAARFYELALGAARKVPGLDSEEHASVWRALGLVRQEAGLLEDSLEAHRRALKTAGSEPVVRADALFHLAQAKDQMSAFSSALRDLTRAARLVGGLSSEEAATLRAEIASFRAVVLYAMERPGDALQQAKEAAALSEAAAARRPLARSLALQEMSKQMLTGPGDGADLRKALAIYEELDDLVYQATVHMNLAILAAITGRWDEAEEGFRTSSELNLRCGNSIEAALAANNLGELLLSRGRLDDAEKVITDALRVMKATHWDEGVDVVNIQMAHVLIERGRYSEAEDILDDTVAEFRSIGQPTSALEATILRAAGRVLDGHPETALTLLEDANAEVDGDTGLLSPKVALVRALALGRLGRLEKAVDVCAVGREKALALALPFEEGLLGRNEIQLRELAGLPDSTESLAASAKKLKALGVVIAPRAFTFAPEI